mgnify:CR=1 FL=1
MLDPITAGVVSLFLPGLGQLLTGKPGRALYFGFLALFVWTVTFAVFGWVINVLAALDAWHRAQPSPDPGLVDGAPFDSRNYMEAPASNVIPFPHHPDAH